MTRTTPTPAKPLTSPFYPQSNGKTLGPDYLPWPLAWVYVSGFFEVLGGVGLAVLRLRRAAGWALIALLAAVT